MGRDKKSPKPLDTAAFHTLVKTAAEVLRRHEQQLYAMHHKSVTVTVRTDRITVTLDIVADEEDPVATLSAHGASGELLARVRAPSSFKLNADSATAWAENGYSKPHG
jgi:hypothetical protein